MKTIVRDLSTTSFLSFVLIFTFASPARAQKTSETPCCRSSIEITSSRSVQLLVNAPNGFETGYDPANYGTLVNQIPSSNYSLGFAGNGSSGVERKLDIGTPAAGRYVLQAIGESSGNFTLNLKATDERGALSIRRFHGTTRPGRTFVYFVEYSPTPNAKFTVTPLTPFSELSANVTVVPDMPPSFRVSATIGLGPSSSFDPIAQPVTFQLGSYAVTIPPGSFIRKDQDNYEYDGTIEGITLDARISPEAGNKFAFALKVQGINLSESINPVRILLILGHNAGAKSVNAVTP
jgi:hypothetical protein